MKQKEKKYHLTDSKFKSMLTQSVKDTTQQCEESINLIFKGGAKDTDDDDASIGGYNLDLNHVPKFDAEFCETLANNVTKRFLQEVRNSEKGIEKIEKGLMGRNLLAICPCYPFVEEFIRIQYTWLWNADATDAALDGTIAICDSNGRGRCISKEALKSLIKNGVFDNKEGIIMVLFDDKPGEREKAFTLIACLLGKRLNAISDANADEASDEYDEDDDADEE